MSVLRKRNFLISFYDFLLCWNSVRKAREREWGEKPDGSNGKRKLELKIVFVTSECLSRAKTEKTEIPEEIICWEKWLFQRCCGIQRMRNGFLRLLWSIQFVKEFHETMKEVSCGNISVVQKWLHDYFSLSFVQSFRFPREVLLTTKRFL